MLPLTISGSSRPRVLVADDHLQVLESVSSFLSTDFDVVATASDGREAVDLALRLQPDIAVLDMAMPGLDGFQTVEELKRHGSPAKPVFLTMLLPSRVPASHVLTGDNFLVDFSRPSCGRLSVNRSEASSCFLLVIHLTAWQVSASHRKRSDYAYDAILVGRLRSDASTLGARTAQRRH